MASERVAQEIGAMSDLELAVLLGMIAGQHILIRSGPVQTNLVGQEVELICLNLFGLSTARVQCHQTMTLDDLAASLLIDDASADEMGSVGAFSLDSKQIASAIVAENLDLAPHAVQIQMLELMRGKRLFTRDGVYFPPKRFMVIGVATSSPPQTLTRMLNDHFFMSHVHLPEDGTPNITEAGGPVRSQSLETQSVSTHLTPSRSIANVQISKLKPIVGIEQLESLQTLAGQVKLDTDVRAYLHDMVAHLRMHRAVGGGISALSTRHFHELVKAMAPLHGIDYITPSIVALATRKIYGHRISITKPEDEMSLQWGSSVQAVRRLLEGVTVENVIEEVIESVKPPL